MGYSFFDTDGLCRALHELRWKFEKGVEYPELGPWHPNLLIEEAIDELHRLDRAHGTAADSTVDTPNENATTNQPLCDGRTRPPVS